MRNMVYRGLEIRVKGKVQGVGFRPFVWQLANEYRLSGDVNNDGQGVLIRILADEKEKTSEKFNAFLYALQNKLPPLAQITSLQIKHSEWDSIIDANLFLIRESEYSQMDTQVIPDAATCPACLNEIFDENNRRFHYPFTNCTHCGPRFTIIRAIPYDRQNTSMRDFKFCDTCKREYKDPADRRFHAQPNACPECGPHIILCNKTEQIAQNYPAILAAADKLRQGYIVAVKGLGGFHLACDATQAKTIDLLRHRKVRPSKPFAVMVPNLDWLTELAEEERLLLQSSAAPIVLLAKHKVRGVHDLVAPDLAEIGVMLPSNPLQHLLMHEVNMPLIMTSGNRSGLPPALDNRDALDSLADLADYWLLHNRDIVQRTDDSLVRVSFDGKETLRRARGYVPNETALSINNDKNILALGADLKNTFCLLRKENAVITQHLGDMQNEQIQQQLIDNIVLFEQIYQFTPDLIAVDAHQGYFTHQLGKTLSEKYNVPLVEVLHHHAHIVSVLAEHNCLEEQVIGLALDGIGMGENAQLWGGECLLVSKNRCKYLGGLPQVALIGGDIAAKQPWRSFLAHCLAFVDNWQNNAQVRQIIKDKNWQPLVRAVEAKINAPLISSAGRLFDAAACALGVVADQITWEGEAACKLENIAWRYAQTGETLRNGITISLNEHNQLNLADFWSDWLALEASSAEKAWIFHYSLAQGLANLARLQADKYHIKTIVLSGGVWHNRLLRYLIKSMLSDFKLLTGHEFPMGDGGIALGQAVIASYY